MDNVHAMCSVSLALIVLRIHYKHFLFGSYFRTVLVPESRWINSKRYIRTMHLDIMQAEIGFWTTSKTFRSHYCQIANLTYSLISDRAVFHALCLSRSLRVKSLEPVFLLQDAVTWPVMRLITKSSGVCAQRADESEKTPLASTHSSQGWLEFFLMILQASPYYCRHTTAQTHPFRSHREWVRPFDVGSDKVWSPCQASNWAMFQTSVATNQMPSLLFVRPDALRTLEHRLHKKAYVYQSDTRKRKKKKTRNE